MSDRTIRFTVELPVERATAFAQFLKRAGHSDYLKFTVRAFPCLRPVSHTN